MALTNFVKNIRNIMRNDAGINGDAQRIEQIAWMLFLNVYDEKENDWVEHLQIIGLYAGLVIGRYPGFDAGQFLEKGFGGLGVFPKVRSQALLRLFLHLFPFAGYVQTAFQVGKPLLQVLDLFECNHRDKDNKKGRIKGKEIPVIFALTGFYVTPSRNPSPRGRDLHCCIKNNH